MRRAILARLAGRAASGSVLGGLPGRASRGRGPGAPPGGARPASTQPRRRVREASRGAALRGCADRAGDRRRGRADHQHAASAGTERNRRQRSGGREHGGAETHASFEGGWQEPDARLEGPGRILAGDQGPRLCLAGARSGDGDVFDWYTSDPMLVTYLSKIHEKVDPWGVTPSRRARCSR